MKHCLILLLLAVCSFSWAQQVETTEIIVEPYAETIERTGKVAFKNTLLLSFKTSGYLKALAVDEGDAFNKAQILAVLDTAELTEDKNSTYALLLQAKRDVLRIEKMRSQNLSSEQALEIAKTNVATARSAHQVAVYNLNKAIIKAPFSGVVLSRYTQLGELQTPGKEALKVAALKNNWVIKVALTGTEIGQIKLNQQANVYLPNTGVVQGKISKIPVIANTDGNLFLIDVTLPEVQQVNRIVAGQLAQVTIPLTSEQIVYRLPIDALIGVNKQGKAIILTQNIDENSFQRRLFDIHKIDNQHVYLVANEQELSLLVVVRGWQNITVK